MAKRRKPGTGKTAPENVTPFPGGSESAPKDFLREKEQMMSLISKKLESSDMSFEEAETFLSQFTGRNMEDVIEALDDMPRSDLDRANDILWDLPEDASTAELEEAAKQALAISEDCMEAWLILSQLAKTDEEAIGLIEKGIARGRELHSDLIASVGEEHGIWGYVEARDFMRLHHELAIAHEQTGDLPAAVATYEEMIRLNPGDNQGVRVPLLHHLITLNRQVEVKALLKRYRDVMTADAGMAYGKVLFEIFRAFTSLSEAQLDSFERIKPVDVKGFRKCFGPTFPPVEKAMKMAIAANHHVPLLMTLPGIMDIEAPEMISLGGPSEAVEYIQRFGALWVAIPIPFMLLGAFGAAIRPRKSRNRREIEELEDIVAAGDLPGLTPWWEEMLEDIED